jgi:hypothetical protein
MGKTRKPSALDPAGTRVKLVGLLTDYLRLQANMTEMENMFLTHVLMPGYQLRETTRRCEFLEGEYTRIKDRIRDGYYSSPAEVEEDVREVLKRSDLEFSRKAVEEAEDDLLRQAPATGWEMVDHDFNPDDKEKDRILREFKRAVIPRIHADTSAAPFEEFQMVYSAYKKKDYLLMKAFIIRYQGDPEPGPGESAEDFAGRTENLARESRHVLESLERRMAGLRQHMSDLELEKQDKVILQLKNQNKEILRSIYEQAEKVLRLQKMLEELIKSPYLVH